MSPLEKIQQEAMSLSEDERIVLADALLASLDPARSQAVEAWWIAESQRRLEQYEQHPERAKSLEDFRGQFGLT